MDTYEQRTANHDRTGTLELVATKAVYWFSDGTTHDGNDAIATVLDANFSAISDETYRIEELRWLSRTEQLAVCTYRFIWTGTIDGAATGGSGRGTSVVEKRHDAWFVLHEHLSTAKE